MKFKFRLESIMKHRKNLEEMARRDYYDAKQTSDGILEQINNLFESNDTVRENSHKAAGDAEFVHLQQMAHEYLERNKIRIERKKMEFREAQSVTENKQEDLVVAAKEAKILEKLKEQKKAEFRDQQRVREKKETDEIVVQRHGREKIS